MYAAKKASGLFFIRAFVLLMLCRILARPQSSPNTRLARMASHITNGSTNGTAHSGVTLKDLPKSNDFTSNLPPDPQFPTPAASHKAPRSKLGPRQVRNALYTFVRPEVVEGSELVGVSPRAMEDIGLAKGEEQTNDFKDMVAGKKLVTWDEVKEEGVYPWAQCYGGMSMKGFTKRPFADPC